MDDTNEGEAIPDAGDHRPPDPQLGGLPLCPRQMKKEHLPGHVVEPPPPGSGCVVISGTYSANTGLEVPIEMHCHPNGLIRRLWEEELARRNEATLKIAEVREIECCPQKKLTD